MNMFPSLLNSIPKNRLDYVEDLDIPYISLSPYVWNEPLDDYYWALRRDSYLSDSLREYDKATLSTDSSIPLSRAMTDSDIDYGFFKRYKNYNYTNTWDHLRDAVNAFPRDYISSLNRYIYLDPLDEDYYNAKLRYKAELAESRRRYREEWRRRMRRRFYDDCCVYSSDDPGLLELEDALRSLDMKALQKDLDRIRPLWSIT